MRCAPAALAVLLLVTASAASAAVPCGDARMQHLGDAYVHALAVARQRRHVAGSAFVAMRRLGEIEDGLAACIAVEPQENARFQISFVLTHVRSDGALFRALAGDLPHALTTQQQTLDLSRDVRDDLIADDAPATDLEPAASSVSYARERLRMIRELAQSTVGKVSVRRASQATARRGD